MSNQGLVGSNKLIRDLAGSSRVIVKTFVKSGVVYHFDDTLKPIAREVAERLIDKGILRAREPSGQSFVLSPEWGGVTP